LSCWELLLDGARRKDDGFDVRAMVTENREIALMSRGGDAENAITDRSVFVTVGGYQSNTTGFGRCEGTIVV
jgi:hypothetical protein